MRSSTRLLALNAFVRMPNYRTIPASGPNGIVVNRDMLIHQFRDFYKVLQQSSLVDKVHVMSERPQLEALRVADHMACIGAAFVGMPLTGMEHRAMEFMETMRYVRGAGGPTTVASYLQDTDSCRCSSGDVVNLPGGIAVGHGPRTNSIAHTTLKQLFEVKDDYSTFDVLTLEQEGDAPPLGDYFGFAGQDILITWKDEHGMLAVDQYQTQRPQHTVNTVYLEPGCHFLSFFGVDLSTDVLVQKGYDRSMESLAAVGLNPIPVQWSEMDKLGVSMRAAVLPLNFLKTNVGGMLTRNRNRSGRWQAHRIAAGTGSPGSGEGRQQPPGVGAGGAPFGGDVPM